MRSEEYMKRIIISCKTENMDEFRKLCEFSKEIGATHVVVSQVEKSIWQWNRNRNDPYPNWSMYNPTFFKYVVPENSENFCLQIMHSAI